MSANVFDFLTAEQKNRLRELTLKAPVIEDLDPSDDVPFLVRIINELVRKCRDSSPTDA